MIPDALADRNKWVCWGHCHGRKVPLSPSDPDADWVDALDAVNWTDWETAQQTAIDHSGVTGVGWTFHNGGPIMGIDLDNCRDPETDEIEQWAWDVINNIDSYTEVSPSGTGVHIYVFANDGLPGDNNKSNDVEMYDSERFFTVTGDHVEGTPQSLREAQTAVNDVYEAHVEDDTEHTETNHSGTEMATNGSLTLSDRELIEKAKKNAETGRQFRRVWNGNYDHHPSHSEARLELYNYLAFWTRKDSKRIWRLFQQSGLYPHPTKPGKCERVKDREIQKAIGDTHNSYDSEWYSKHDRLPESTKQVATDGDRMTVSDPTVVAVIEALEELGTAPASDIESHAAVDRGIDQVRRAINFLKEHGTIKWERDGRNVVYSLLDQ